MSEPVMKELQKISRNTGCILIAIVVAMAPMAIAALVMMAAIQAIAAP